MATPPSAPPGVPEKRGLGCFGWGCAVLVVLLLLIGGLIAGISYFGYSKISNLTSTAPTTVRTYDGGDTVYQSAIQKTNTFDQAVQRDQPATLELSADEINTLIARDPDFTKYQIRAFVTMTGDHGDMQISLPTNLIPYGLIKDRYLNVEAEFTPAFDPSTKALNFTLHTFKFGGGSVPPAQLTTVQNNLNPLLNTQLQNSDAAKQILDRAQVIEIRDGKLIIKMQ
jgi:hypothetical protein